MLNVGDKAPDFDLMSDAGKQVKLRELKGQNVVLYFYPKDDTPGCTKQACTFRDQLPQYFDRQALVFGVSLDSVASHQKFKQKYGLPFSLLADEGAAVSKAYGVYKKKSMWGRSYWGIERTTFVIGPDQKIKAIFPKVKVGGHSEAVLAALAAT
jgi:thioredoxin-dependent peroxiredoxin